MLMSYGSSKEKNQFQAMSIDVIASNKAVVLVT